MNRATYVHTWGGYNRGFYSRPNAWINNNVYVNRNINVNQNVNVNRNVNVNQNVNRNVNVNQNVNANRNLNQNVNRNLNQNQNLNRGYTHNVGSTSAEYGKSGISTFIVNQLGDVYEKDLGNGTAAAAKSIREFNPDTSWKRVSDH